MDRLHVLDVGVSVEAPTHANSGILGGDYQCIAVCHTTRVIAIANGRFVDIYGTSGNSLHPFAFLHQIAIADHVTHPHGSLSSKAGPPELSKVVATSVAFPLSGFLVVGAFVEDPEISETSGTVNPARTALLLGFRLYPGSATQCVEAVNGGKPSASIQVYFSFVEPIEGVDVKSIRCLQSFRHDMTPDAGSMLVIFEGCACFGVFTWRERLSDRQICLAQMKQQIVVADLSPDGLYLVLGDMGGQLSLIDLRGFQKDENGISDRSQKVVGGKRLQLGSCFSSGVKATDNPLEQARLTHTLAASSIDCAYTSLRWWSYSVQDQQKQFVLAGKRDGSLSVRSCCDESRSVYLNFCLMLGIQSR
ncbi:hypothetical protein DVH05_010532 [Phytophthora capsici]|nr:hypothetical protein DVH05_010532 [Phytophthora capsici]